MYHVSPWLKFACIRILTRYLVAAVKNQSSIKQANCTAIVRLMTQNFYCQTYNSYCLCSICLASIQESPCLQKVLSFPFFTFQIQTKQMPKETTWGMKSCRPETFIFDYLNTLINKTRQCQLVPMYNMRFYTEICKCRILVKQVTGKTSDRVNLRLICILHVDEVISLANLLLA